MQILHHKEIDLRLQGEKVEVLHLKERGSALSGMVPSSDKQQSHRNTRHLEPQLDTSKPQHGHVESTLAAKGQSLPKILQLCSIMKSLK